MTSDQERIRQMFRDAAPGDGARPSPQEWEAFRRRARRSHRLHRMASAVTAVAVAAALSTSGYAVAGQVGNEPPPPPKLVPSERHPHPSILLSLGPGGVYAIDPVAGTRRVIVDHLPTFLDGAATWSPDHRHIAYVAGEGKAQRVVVTDASGGSPRVVARTAGPYAPAWSPSGKRLAYVAGGKIRITPLHGGETERLKLPSGLAAFHLDWAPGPAIAFTGMLMRGNSSSGTTDIRTIDPNSPRPHQLTHDRHAFQPKWSPGGDRLLFLKRESRTGGATAWVAPADGTGKPRRLLPYDDVRAADWSPDGRRVVAVRGTKTALSVWVFRADGSHQRHLGSPIRPFGSPIPSSGDATVSW